MAGLLRCSPPSQEASWEARSRLRVELVGQQAAQSALKRRVSHATATSGLRVRVTDWPATSQDPLGSGAIAPGTGYTTTRSKGVERRPIPHGTARRTSPVGCLSSAPPPSWRAPASCAFRSGLGSPSEEWRDGAPTPIQRWRLLGTMCHTFATPALHALLRRYPLDSQKAHSAPGFLLHSTRGSMANECYDVPARKWAVLSTPFPASSKKKEQGAERSSWSVDKIRERRKKRSDAVQVCAAKSKALINRATWLSGKRKHSKTYCVPFRSLAPRLKFLGTSRSSSSSGQRRFNFLMLLFVCFSTAEERKLTPFLDTQPPGAGRCAGSCNRYRVRR